MYAVVTGAAGFIGSHVSEQLLAQGVTVRGIDSFTPYYDRQIKRSNASVLNSYHRFELIEADLRCAMLEELVDGAEVVYHLAAQPGVRGSWEQGFQTYVEMNIIATQRLLEAVRRTPVNSLVYASSSSVYGSALRYPTQEHDLTHPYSPYGVTKLAAEQLCRTYADNFGVTTAALRYFTVYGPRQRPEMAIQQLVDCALTGRPFRMFGTGEAVRDFTYVGDIARATVAAGLAEVPPGTVMNVCGGAPVSLAEVIDVVGEVVGRPPPVERVAASPGDVKRTGGVSERAMKQLGWTPSVDLVDGIVEQVRWTARQQQAA